MNTNNEKMHTVSDLEGNQADHRTADPTEAHEGATTSPEAVAVKHEEIKSLNEKYLRLAAEFENYKRLSQRDQREQTKFANENLIRELLPVVDNLQRAMQFAAPDPKANGLVQGVELTLKQFLETLGRFGVKPIKSIGEPFDPSVHQAVSRTETSDAPVHTVLQEHQSGYLLHDRTLRPAMVTVAAPVGVSQPSPEQEGEHHG